MCKLRIRDLREDFDLSQQQVADLLKTTRQQYGKYETKTQEIPVRHIVTLARHYGVSIDYLLGNTTDPTPPKEKAPAVKEGAQALRMLFHEKKGREPTQDELLQLKNFAETFINGMNK